MLELISALPAGAPMAEGDWHAPDASAFAMLLDGRLAVLFNRGRAPVEFSLPPTRAWTDAPDGRVTAGARAVVFVTASDPKRPAGRRPARLSAPV